MNIVAGLVPIIAPAFNVENVIADAISSALLQAYPSWQLLIVDDGSTDNTSEIVRQFDDPRITLFCTANKGVSAAQNRSLKNALGGFIAFLDADGLFFEMYPDISQVVLCRYPGISGILLPGLLNSDESIFKNISFFFGLASLKNSL